jgi:hypothetical protein
MSGANYNGKQPNNSSYVKNFVEGDVFDIWTLDSVNNVEVITPTPPLTDVYIPGNLYISGEIIHIPPINAMNRQEQSVNTTNYSGEIIPLLIKQIQELQEQVRHLVNISKNESP